MPEQAQSSAHEANCNPESVYKTFQAERTDLNQDVQRLHRGVIKQEYEHNGTYRTREADRAAGLGEIINAITTGPIPWGAEVEYRDVEDGPGCRLKLAEADLILQNQYVWMEGDLIVVSGKPKTATRNRPTESEVTNSETISIIPLVDSYSVPDELVPFAETKELTYNEEQNELEITIFGKKISIAPEDILNEEENGYDREKLNALILTEEFQTILSNIGALKSTFFTEVDRARDFEVFQESPDYLSFRFIISGTDEYPRKDISIEALKSPDFDAEVLVKGMFPEVETTFNNTESTETVDASTRFEITDEFPTGIELANFSTVLGQNITLSHVTKANLELYYNEGGDNQKVITLKIEDLIKQDGDQSYLDITLTKRYIAEALEAETNGEPEIEEVVEAVDKDTILTDIEDKIGQTDLKTNGLQIGQHTVDFYSQTDNALFFTVAEDVMMSVTLEDDALFYGIKDGRPAEAKNDYKPYDSLDHVESFIDGLEDAADVVPEPIDLPTEKTVDVIEFTTETVIPDLKEKDINWDNNPQFIAREGNIQIDGQSLIYEDVTNLEAVVIYLNANIEDIKIAVVGEVEEADLEAEPDTEPEPFTLSEDLTYTDALYEAYDIKDKTSLEAHMQDVSLALAALETADQADEEVARLNRRLTENLQALGTLHRKHDEVSRAMEQLKGRYASQTDGDPQPKVTAFDTVATQIEELEALPRPNVFEHGFDLSPLEAQYEAFKVEAEAEGTDEVFTVEDLLTALETDNFTTNESLVDVVYQSEPEAYDPNGQPIEGAAAKSYRLTGRVFGGAFLEAKPLGNDFVTVYIRQKNGDGTPEMDVIDRKVETAETPLEEVQAILADYSQEGFALDKDQLEADATTVFNYILETDQSRDDLRFALLYESNQDIGFRIKNSENFYSFDNGAANKLAERKGLELEQLKKLLRTYWGPEDSE